MSFDLKLQMFVGQHIEKTSAQKRKRGVFVVDLLFQNCQNQMGLFLKNQNNKHSLIKENQQEYK